MARKRKTEMDTPPKVKKTIYEAAKEVNWSVRYQEDMLFSLLILIGFPAAKAYRAAYPTSSASVASSAVMASRKLQEESVQNFLRSLLNYYWFDSLCLNTNCIKGRPIRWPRWMGKKAKNLSD